MSDDAAIVRVRDLHKSFTRGEETIEVLMDLNVDVAEGSSPAQACQSVLQCLNDVDCLKTYCQATTIRSGWKLESAW